MTNEVIIEDVNIGSVANVKHKCSFKELNSIYERLENWIGKNNFISEGTYHFRFDSENKDVSSDNILFELAIPVKKPNQDENSIKIVQIPDQDVISGVYKGPYFNLPSVYGILEDYARKNDLAPMEYAKEIYLNDPLDVNSNDLLTEVQLTVFEFHPENIQQVPLLSKIKRKTVPKQKMATIYHHGFLEDVYKVRLDLIKWAEKHDIEVDGLYFQQYPEPVGTPYRGMVFKVGVPIYNDLKEDDEIKIVEVPEHEVLSTIFKGPYVSLPNVHRMIVDYAFENDLELIDFPEEIYLNSIFDVGCDELLTEVRIPTTDYNLNKNIQFEGEIEKKTVERHEIASIGQVGSFEKISQIKEDLFNWIEKNNIKTTGPHYLKFHNHPCSLSPENISYEIGVPLDSTVEDVIKVIDYTRHKILVTKHNGPISTLKDTHDFIKNYSKENGFVHLDLLINTFVDKIPENHEDDVLITVGLPVKKI
ncbi:MAG: GyrI-like domain-containing protein [Methanobrevibacter sp.]|nr:GyrI-like domain-containing protein [Methanobrevibacter sp.]